jgi:protein tyrosine phosphatase (PTP) superfamily phosphohydrolase (DUF442 family)
MRTTRLISSALLPLVFAAVVAARAATPVADGPFPSLPADALHNAHRVTDKVLAGAAPEGDAAFAALQELGVKTIISVDGARPDVATAKKHGLRYVHLPIGYDDVSAAEGKAIAKAIDEVEGPIYVHCHHGKHRSAAAVAVACVMNGRLRPEQAESVLTTFGTGGNYKGLWASARAARPLDRQVLRDVKVDYRETAPIPPMAEAMVAVDQTWERLRLAEKAGWRSPAVHPDIDPPHEALQLMEKLRELGRADETKAHPHDFRKILTASEAAAETLHESLATWSRAGRRGAPPVEATAAMKSLGTSCTACHKAFRD